MTDEAPEIVLRPMVSDDVPFVLSSWLRSHRRTGDVGHMSDTRYFSSYRQHVLALLRTSTVVVASPVEDAGQIVGYICVDHIRGFVHFAYVKHVFRRFGVARRLWDHVGRPAIATTRWPSSVHRDGSYHVTWHSGAARRLGIEFDPFTTEGSHAKYPSHPG